MKVIMCDCGHVTGIDVLVLNLLKTDYMICAECKEKMDLTRHFKKYLSLRCSS